MGKVRRQAVRALIMAPLLLWTGCAARTPVREAAAVPPAFESSPLYEDLQEHLRRGDAPAALAEFERRRGDRANGDPPYGPQERLLYARLLMLAGRTAESLRELESLEGQIGLPAAPELRVEILFHRALLAGLEGDRPAEAGLLDRVLAADQDHALALTARGELYLLEGDLPRAERCFGDALRGDPRLAVALTGLGGVRIRQGRYEEAAGLLDRAILLEPDQAAAWQERARARVGLDDLAGAVEDLTRALQMQPDHYWSYLDRGRLYLRLRNREAARRDFSEAIGRAPGSFSAYVYRAGLNYEEDRLAEARQDFERVIELRPDYSPAYAPLGTLYYIQGDWPRAEKLFAAGRAVGDEEPARALMAALAIQQQGQDGRAATYLEAVMARLPADSWIREVGRYLIDPGLEPRLLQRIERERNPILRRRLLFYMGVRSLRVGRARQAQSCLLEVRDGLPGEYWEQKIARWLLEGGPKIDETRD